MGKVHRLVTQAAPGSPMHSAPLSCLGLSHDSTPTASFDARLVDLLRPRPMRSCSLVQASTQMPTSLVVAAYERRCVRSTLERERRAASHQCAAREPPGPESRRGTMEHAQESTLADRRPQSGRQERAGDGRSKRPPSRAQGKNLEKFFFWHGDAKPQVRPRACPPPARRRCSSHAFSTTGSNAGTGRPAADPSFIGGRRTKGARQGFGVSFVRSFVCCTCTCTHARVRAHAFAHAKARSADLSSNLPKVAARKSCVQLLPPHMGDTVPLLKPHPIYEGILGTLYAHRRAAATRRTSSHSTPPRTGVPPW